MNELVLSIFSSQYMLIAEVEATLDMIVSQEEAEGAVLVFLPGMPEITRMHDTLRHSPVFGDDRRFQLASQLSVSLVASWL